MLIAEVLSIVGLHLGEMRFLLPHTQCGAAAGRTGLDDKTRRRSTLHCGQKPSYRDTEIASLQEADRSRRAPSQPRRGDTSVTPHKRSAVWGSTPVGHTSITAYEANYHKHSYLQENTQTKTHQMTDNVSYSDLKPH